MMRKITFAILCSVLTSCMVDVSNWLANEDGNDYDVNEFFTVPVIMSDSIVEKHLWTTFGLNGSTNDRIDVLKYPDSLGGRVKYQFAIGGFTTIELNSFSFTRQKDGDTIPSTLYYRNYITDSRVIIDSLPVIFTKDVKEITLGGTFAIYAECSQAYYVTEQVYVNYDIEVGNRRYVKQVKYSKKRNWDWRPKI